MKFYLPVATDAQIFDNENNSTITLMNDVLMGRLNATRTGTVHYDGADGSFVTFAEIEVDEDAFRDLRFKTGHNPRGAGMPPVDIQTNNLGYEKMTWPEFVEATKDMGRQKVIDTFGLVTPKRRGAEKCELRSISRKLLMNRMASGAKEYERVRDDTHDFLWYLNAESRHYDPFVPKAC